MLMVCQSQFSTSHRAIRLVKQQFWHIGVRFKFKFDFVEPHLVELNVQVS